MPPVQTNGRGKGMLLRSILLSLWAVGRQQGKQEDKLSCYQETKTTSRQAVHSLVRTDWRPKA